MRVLFSALGSYGHVLPLVPLARAAVDAGHDVVFATTRAMTATLHDAGLTDDPVGIPIVEAFAKLDVGDVPLADRPTISGLDDLISRAFGEVLPDAFRTDLITVIDRRRPGLVAAEASNIGAMQAAAETGVPCVRHGIGRGLPFGFAASNLPHLDICPPSMQDRVVLDLPGYRTVRPVAHSSGGPLPTIVGERTDLPLVYVTLGTEFGGADALAAIIRAVDTGDRRVVVATGHPVTLPDHSDLVEVASWVPQGAVIARADVVVHHGGAGTTLGTCAAGVPQLVLPQGADNFRNADAVVARGVGEQIRPAEKSEPMIAAAVDRLLHHDTSVRRAAAAVASEIAGMPSPADVAADLESIADWSVA